MPRVATRAALQTPAGVADRYIPLFVTSSEAGRDRAGLPAPHHHPDALEGQRRLRAREQRRVLLVLRHRDQRVADRGGRARHPRGRGDRGVRGVALRVQGRDRVPGDDRRRACASASSAARACATSSSWAAPASRARSRSGWFVHVFVDRETRRPVEIPAPIRSSSGASSERMKVRGAVLREMGLEPPYAESKPLSIVELELDPPGPGELLVRDARRGAVPLRPVGDRRLAPARDADGARARGGGRGGRARPGRGGLRGRRSRGHDVRAGLRALRAVPRRPRAAVRSRAPRRTPPARCSAASAAGAGTRATSSTTTSASVRVRGVRGGVGALGGEGRRRAAVRDRRAVRLRGVDRRWRGGERGARADGRPRGDLRARRSGARGAARRAGGGRDDDRRRPTACSRSSTSPASWGRRTRSWPGPTRSSRCARPRAAGPTA